MPVKIHLNLCVALALAIIAFFAANQGDSSSSSSSCFAWAALMHFFFLSSVMWMFVEGMGVYRDIVKVLDSHWFDCSKGTYFSMAMIGGWGNIQYYSTCFELNCVICVIVFLLLLYHVSGLPLLVTASLAVVHKSTNDLEIYGLVQVYLQKTKVDTS